MSGVLFLWLQNILPQILYCFSGPNGIITHHCCDLKFSGVINPAEYKTKNWWIVLKSHCTVLLQGEMRHPENSNHANGKNNACVTQRTLFPAYPLF